MKKTIALLLSCTLALFLISCGSASSSEVQTPTVVSTSASESTAENESSQAVDSSKVTIEETVLLDDSGVKITAKELSMDGVFGPEIKILIENDSGLDLTFQCRNTSVNGYMTDMNLSSDVVSGKKANDSILIMRSDLQSVGIDTIADVQFSFHIFTTDEWETYLDTPIIQLNTSAAETYEYVFDDSGDLVYDDNAIKIVVKGLSQDESFLGPSVVIYMENNSDQNITIQTRDVSVNGFMTDVVFSPEIVAGMHSIDSITFFSSDLEENDIQDIETIELSFHIFTTEGWDTIADSEPISLSF